MPPTFDVYVWIDSSPSPELIREFVDSYVDEDAPGDPRFATFIRVFVDENGTASDRKRLAELRRDNTARNAFSLYVNARHHDGAILTLTEEGALVLGLGIDAGSTEDDVQLTSSARSLALKLRDQFSAAAYVGGVELAPAQRRAEWNDDSLVLIRDGFV